ncbi:SIR2 family protein [Denitrificimonas sp. JX-1]|uniref:SIR2 family protein n=1 Tax=Denitrificimonas halotolerans TaxID=3098930 RepID=A0ABU5GUG8_9GAMM|nr:SIR2 family protein [Denitrificimonas sp. JX-1]MDY7220287.1 SIR2 family protein [Denitrificimonas sp. JX-1]
MTEISFYSSEANQLDDNNMPASVDIDDKENKVVSSLVRFVNQLVDAENLIILAGSGTSLTFNKDGQAAIAPSMTDLWHSCESLDASKFEEVLKSVNYADVAGTWPDGEQKKDIELLLSLCDSYLPLKNLSATRQRRVTNFLSEAKNKIIKETSFVDKVKSEDWQSHNKFINTLGKRSPKQKRLKVFTTNYDLAFEVAASNTGVIVIDGFEFSKPYRFNPAWYQYDIVNRSQASEKGGAYLTNIIHLYKVHGSVDWVRRGTGVYKKDESAAVGGEPVFIYPSSTKYQNSYDSPYLDMMAAFLEAVQKPKTALLCVGFGFNDKHLNNAITMALRTNPEFMIMVATKDPFDTNGSFNAEVRTQFMSAIKAGDSRIGIADCSFKSLASLLPNRHKPSPEETLLSMFEQVIAKGSEQ